MGIGDKEVERIATDLIREIAHGWSDTPTTRCIEENNSYLFEFKIPSRRYSQKADRSVSWSVFRFNPLAEAIEVVRTAVSAVEHRSIENNAVMMDLVRMNAAPRIYQMLLIVPQIIGDSLWQARVTAETLRTISVMEALGRPDVARKAINAMVELIEQKVRQRLGTVQQKQKPKITPIRISAAISPFLPAFEETGAIPSRNKFAKQLGVSPKGWRDYLRTHELGEHEEYLRKLFEKFS